MSITQINIGNAVNDGLGDDLRTAFQKVNSNFQALDVAIKVTASLTDVPGYSIFKEKVGTALIFKRLQSGKSISIEETPDAVIITNSSSDAFSKITTDTGSISGSSFQEISLLGSADISVSSNSATINLSNKIPVTSILTTYDFGPIDGVYSNAIQFILAAINIDFGTLLNPSMLNLDCGTLG
jgi:hypothetical protein